MRLSTITRNMRFDAPFWALLLLALLSLVSIGCFSVAVAQASGEQSAIIVTTDNCPPPPDL
jgi:hypothetical protein